MFMVSVCLPPWNKNMCPEQKKMEENEATLENPRPMKHLDVAVQQGTEGIAAIDGQTDRKKQTLPDLEDYHPRSLTARPWKTVVGRLLSYWVPVTFQGLCSTSGGSKYHALKSSFQVKGGWSGVAASLENKSCPLDSKITVNHPFFVIKHLVANGFQWLVNRDLNHPQGWNPYKRSLKWVQFQPNHEMIQSSSHSIPKLLTCETTRCHIRQWLLCSAPSWQEVDLSQLQYQWWLKYKVIHGG